MTTEISRYDQARTALAEAKTVQEVKTLRDKAEAMRQYARRAKDEEFQQWAAEIKLRAERKAGKMLMDMAEKKERATQDHGGANIPTVYHDGTPSLDELGITRNECSRWQREASVPDDMFEQFLQEPGALTSTALLRLYSDITNEETKRELIPPDGKYSCIIIDPPWPMVKIEREVVPEQAGFDYPTMPLEEIESFPVDDMAHDDCHLFLWTTPKFLPDAFDIMNAWGFRYISPMVWHKPGGFQPFGLFQYNCEFVLYGRKGTPKFVDTKNAFCCFSAPRREHSRKPDEFYDLVRRVTDGPRIDVFSRELRDGFDQYGFETDRFNVA